MVDTRVSVNQALSFFFNCNYNCQSLNTAGFSTILCRILQMLKTVILAFTAGPWNINNTATYPDKTVRWSFYVSETNSVTHSTDETVIKQRVIILTQ